MKDDEDPKLVTLEHGFEMGVLDVEQLQQNVRSLLTSIGENPDREGLRETPARVVRAWLEWTEGYHKHPADVLKSFKDGASRKGEMVMVTDIPIYSHCEHHLAPFFGHAHIAYIPNDRIVGLSKLARLVNVFAHRLQVQERMTNQIADSFYEYVQPVGVAILVRCRHMCMESRGIRSQGSTTLTSACRGSFATDMGARNEFFAILGQTEARSSSANTDE